MIAMKRVHLFAGALIALAALIIGCAGSSSPQPTTDGGSNPATARIEAVVVVDRSNLKDPSKYTDEQLQNPLQVDPNDLRDPNLWGIQDPRNIQTGEAYYFQLVDYDTGTRHLIPNANIQWTTSTPNGTFGQIGVNSGLFIASNRTTQATQFVFAQLGGTRYEVAYNILPRQVRLIGKCLDEDTGQPVVNEDASSPDYKKGVELFFFDDFNSLVGQVRSAVDGSFRASVPTNATKFAATVASMPTNYFQTFMFNSLRYTIGVPACKATLPTFTLVGPYVLNQPVLFKNRSGGGSTPDPTGCSN